MFMWRHFHMNTPSKDDHVHTEDDEDDSNGNEDDLHFATMERIVQDQLEQQHEELENSEDKTAEQTNKKNEEEVKLWFDKVKPFINHFRAVSMAMVFTLGTLLSIDEMMIRFMGRSGETHKMRNKPILQGFKFIVLTTIKGLILYFTPDGRKAADTKGRNEYHVKSNKLKICKIVLYLADIIKKLKEQQLKQIKNYSTTRSTRNTRAPIDDETIMDKFVIAMDNFFTLPTVMKLLRCWALE